MGYEIRPSGYVADVKAKLFQVSRSSYETRGAVDTVDNGDFSGLQHLLPIPR